MQTGGIRGGGGDEQDIEAPGLELEMGTETGGGNCARAWLARPHLIPPCASRHREVARSSQRVRRDGRRRAAASQSSRPAADWSHAPTCSCRLQARNGARDADGSSRDRVRPPRALRAEAASARAAAAAAAAASEARDPAAAGAGAGAGAGPWPRAGAGATAANSYDCACDPAEYSVALRQVLASTQHAQHQHQWQQQQEWQQHQQQQQQQSPRSPSVPVDDDVE